MKLALSILFVVAIFLTVSVYAGPRKNALRNKRYRVKGRYRSSDFRRARLNNQKRLLGPNGKNAFLRRVKLKKTPQPVIDPASRGPGSRPKVRFVRKRRSQVNGNMGPNPVPPEPVPPNQIISPGPSEPPNSDISEPPPENLAQMSNVERNEVALSFFIKANYTNGGLGNAGSALGSKKDMVRLMQRNYGLPQTGVLDDETVSYMMAPRCGYPDPPANYQTFPNNEHWTHNPVTYIFKGYTPDLSPCQVRNELKRALRVWEEVIELNFAETKNEDNADMIIFFGYKEHGDGYAFDEKNGLLAHAFTAGSAPLAGDTHFDEAEYWKLETGKEKETYYGNSDGAPCVFPFTYENDEYTTCTTAGRSDGLEWCSTTENFDRDGKIGFCPQETLFTYGGNANGKPCSFPFVFQNQRYESCTFEGRTDGYRWCATTPNFDDDSEWGFCPDRAHGTYGGNSDGASCSFPFVFNGNTYTDCTVVGRNDFLPWCSTTPDYDRDQKYGFCQTSGYSLFFVAAHEFGHAIGLDHSSDQSALMYPTYQNFQNFQLPEDDRRGALALYSPRTSRLRPLTLEKCGGDIQLPGGGPEITSTTGDRSSTTPRRTTTTPSPTPPLLQDLLCDSNTAIDALLYFGREIFVFKGRQFWRMYDLKGTKRGPYIISEQWPGLPNAIDAVYKRPGDDALVFFKGFRHWVYDGFQLREGYPKKLTFLGFPAQSTIVVDAALNWLRSKNRKRTYFYVGDEYYRYNEEANKMDKSYPKSMSQWRRVPENVNAAMEDPGKKRQSLFIKDNIVYVLHNYKVQVIETLPVNVWLGCVPRIAGPAPLVSNLPDRRIP